jgi:hypothetical protein
MINLFGRISKGIVRRAEPPQNRNLYHEAQDYIQEITAQDPLGVYDRAMELWNAKPTLEPSQYVRQAREEIAAREKS